MCKIPYRAVVTVSRCQWYLSTCRPKYKLIAVVDTYNTIHQVGTQIDTLPEVMLTAAVMAWGKILLLWRLYGILMRRRWGGLLIEWRVGLWTVLLGGHLMVRQSSLLTVLGLHETVSTDWRASRWLNTDYSQSYSWTSTDGTLSSRGRRSRREYSNFH